MRYISFFIISFLLIALIIPSNLKLQQLKITQDTKIDYDVSIEDAVEDASSELVKTDDTVSSELSRRGKEINVKYVKPNLSKILDRFYKTMFINMKIDNDKAAQDGFKIYCPLKLITAYDGYYANTWENSDIPNKVREVWKPKKPYTYLDEKDKLSINFTLNNFVSVFDLNTNNWVEGDRSLLAAQYPACSIFSLNNFNTFRKKAIVDNIQKDLKYYTAVNNAIARRNNWAYDFNISYIDDDNTFNTITDVSFFAFFQGLPIEGTASTYSTYAFSISKVVNAQKYKGNIINGKEYYHEKDCPYAANSNVIFDTKVKAAESGYYPCPFCSP